MPAPSTIVTFTDAEGDEFSVRLLGSPAVTATGRRAEAAAARRIRRWRGSSVAAEQVERKVDTVGIRELAEAIRLRRQAEDQVIEAETWYSLPEGVLQVRYEALLRARRAEADAFAALDSSEGGEA